MFTFINKRKKSEFFFIICACILAVGIILVPSHYEKKQLVEHSTRVKSLILDADNSGLRTFGVIPQGDQELRIRILEGKYKGLELTAGNTVIGKLEIDKVFKKGDTAFTVLDIDPSTGNILYANVIDFYRLDAELILIIIFALLLVGMAGWTGLKALVSFFFTITVIWKILIPLLLLNLNPVLITINITLILSAVIIFLVAGFTKKGIVAFCGAFSGIVFTAVFSLIFGHVFRVNGAVVPFSEAVLNSGFTFLNLNLLLLSGVFLASSGAVMDIAMDISASMEEVHHKKPSISIKEHILSGINVSRTVIGTMITTLLLAYSGGYVTLLMLLVIQGIPLENILNSSYVSTEILLTLVGSFGLVLVAPITSVIGGFIFHIKYQLITVTEPLTSTPKIIEADFQRKLSG